MEKNTQILKEKILEMAALVDHSLRQCFDPQISLDELFAVENQINQMNKEIDDRCYKYLALAAPLAKDLRMTLTVLKMNCDVERLGDLAITIKRSHQKLKQIPVEVDQMWGEVHVVVNNVFHAFDCADVLLAAEIIRHDEEINQMETRIIKGQIALVSVGKISMKDALRVIEVAKGLERLGDHATNIAEEVIFLESGKDIRHTQKLREGSL